jgi:integrase
MGYKDYICARSDGNLMFRRRVPKELEHLDHRREIRTSLKTKDEHVAALKAREINDKLEAYWGALQRGEEAKTPFERYLAAVETARSFGYRYRPIDELISSGLGVDLEGRILAAEQVVMSAPAAAEALLGTTPEPLLMLSGLYDEYAAHNALKLSGMSAKQRHIHEGQRRTAVKYLMEVLKGDKAVSQLVRKDALDFKAWWIKKVEADGLTIEAPNKSFSNLKGMLTVVDNALQTDYSSVWTKLNLKPTTKTKAKPRPPYPLDFIQNALLAPGALDGMNFQARMVLYFMVETGLRPSEIVNLQRQYILLDHPIPHVVIEEREDRVLKTDASVRTIPLVGVSLWAAKQCPDGFPAYFDNSDSLSACVNSYLRENNLRPTGRHSLYSLRHSFQDRILAAKALDRVQADLMGHAFDREKYGEGSTLEAKLELLESIRFEWSQS